MTRLAALVVAAAAFPAGAEAACRNEASGAPRYVVCEFNPQSDDLRLFLNAESGRPYGEFDLVSAGLEAKGETLLFAMNAGMYHKDRTPVGLYVENGVELKKLSTKDGPGNFHLLPNGVFWIGEGGAAGVTETSEFVARFHPPKAGEREKVAYATQSGPMLVIGGAIHPKFLADATSRKRRNGVGVREDGLVVFALSDTAVTFHEFALYFRDTMSVPNALYLDGTISRIFAADLGRNDPGLAMGPIVGVVKAAD